MIFEPQKVRRPIAEQKAVAKLVELLQSARAPLLVVGAGANRKMTCKMLRKFVDQTKIPFVDTMCALLFPRRFACSLPPGRFST